MKYHSPVHRAVFMVGGQDLVTRLKIEIADDHIDRRRRVGEVNQILRRTIKITRQFFTRFCQQGDRASAKKFNRLSLQLSLPGLIDIKNWFGAGAKGTMIEKGDFRVKKKVIFHQKYETPNYVSGRILPRFP